MALFQKLKAASDERQERATKMERATNLEDVSERSKKDEDIELDDKK